MKNADRLSAGVIIGICAYFLIATRTFERFGSLFPRVITIILAVLAVALFVVSFFKSPVKNEKEEGVRITSVLLIILLIVCWAFFINVLGFLVTSIVFFALITIVFDRRKRTPYHLILKVGSVGATVSGFYLFFAKLLLVPFPRGLLF